MLYALARPWLFGLKPEAAHDLTMATLGRAGRLARVIACPPPALPVKAMGLEFPNPVGLAAGLDKDGEAIDGLAALGFGFLELGTATPRPQPGNPKPRMFRVARAEALVNRMGFNNEGIDRLVAQIKRARFSGIIGVNIGKNKDTPNERAVDDYLHCLRKAHPVASYITVNVSSPNTAGLRDLQSEEALADLLAALKQETRELDRSSGRRVPLALKVAPDQTDESFAALVRAINRVPPAAVIAGNTTVDKSLLGDDPIAEEAGGLSGAPLRQRADEVLSALRDELDEAIDLIGVGGITQGEHGAEKIRRGARLVQLYSGLIFRGPALVGETGHAIKAALQR